MKYRKFGASSPTTIGGYDTAGNLHQTLVHDSVGDISYRYAYDNLYQLIHEEGVFGDDYSYDSINNRLQKNDAPQHINSLNQLLSDSATAYSYNQNGNLIEMTHADVHLTFFYDALDRLVAIERPTVFRVEFFYDSPQRRLIQRRFSWQDGAWQPPEETRFVYFGD
jgi:hypothetical protein